LSQGYFCGTAFYGIRAELQTAIELGEQMLRLAQRADDPLLVAVGHLSLGWPLVSLGDFAQARAHLEHMIAFYDPQQHRSLAFIYGHDHGVTSRAWEAWALWFLGYPEQALKRSREALALAQGLDHPFTLAFALSVAGVGFHEFRREVQAAQELNERLIRLSAEEGLVFYQAIGTIQRGWLQTEAGQVEEGIALMIEGMAVWQARGTMAYRVYCLSLLAEAYGKAGKIEEGLSVLSEALDAVEKTGERFWQAELYRLKGELLLMQGDETEAEASFHQAESCFQHAIEVARRQQAKSWELRVAMSLSRLRQKQGKREEARQMLAEIYSWFTEGFDTPDLKEAKALLEELS
jgi:predicted ATPase